MPPPAAPETGSQDPTASSSSSAPRVRSRSPLAVTRVEQEVERIEGRVSACMTARRSCRRARNCAFELEIEYDKSRRQAREFALHPGAFVVSQLKRQRAEVSERHLDEKHMQELLQAKQKEVRNYLKHQAVEATATAFDVPVRELMKMRWVITMRSILMVPTR